MKNIFWILAGVVAIVCLYTLSPIKVVFVDMAQTPYTIELGSTDDFEDDEDEEFEYEYEPELSCPVTQPANLDI